MIESGFHNFTDRILVVDCSTETQIDRLIERDGITKEHARNILDNQIDREKRLEFATEIVTNEKENLLIEIKEQVKSIHDLYLDLIRTQEK